MSQLLRCYGSGRYMEYTIHEVLARAEKCKFESKWDISKVFTNAFINMNTFKIPFYIYTKALKFKYSRKSL